MKTVVESFLETASRFPDRPAVEDRMGAYTYDQLDRLSNLIAEEVLHALADTDAPPLLASFPDCHPVAVVLSRRKEVLAALLGILRSGNCYVFSAPDAPEERLAFLLRDAGIRCILTEKGMHLPAECTQHGKGGCAVLSIEEILCRFQGGQLPTRPIHVRRDGSDPAFITYTSGSTGTPKGVVETYAYLDNHNRARHSFYTPEPEECIGGIVSFSYAASTYDLFSGLMVGCNLYLFSEAELLDQQVLQQRILSRNITSMFMIPSMIPVVFSPGVMLPIRFVLTAGEKARRFPDIPARVAEIYGSSEAAAVTGRFLSPEDPWDLLGKPIPGTELFLLNEEGERITVPGETGELCIVNDALALGYLNRPEETAKRFRPCPFREGKKMLVSGDMMRFDEAGNYYTCGRRDNMVKLNGQRVEMGEIEAAVLRHPDVEDAVCGVVQRNGRDLLVCWYIPKDPAPSSGALEETVASRLPRHMVPVCWLPVESFPKNINGKVDRHALPEPDFSETARNIPPRNEPEAKLLEEARALLPDIPFGVTDDLPGLGMDSILAVQYVSRIEALVPGVTVSDVLRLRNIRDTLSAPKRIGWFHVPPDPARPTLVLVHGVIPVSGFSRLCDLWSRWFNLYEIEPFPDHVLRELGRYDYEALIALYQALLERELPVDTELWGFAGFSFGGLLAVSLADAWRKRTGERKPVIMGDTYIRVIRPGKPFPHLTEEDPFLRMMHERGKLYGDAAVNEPMDITLRKQNAVVDLLNTMPSNQPYDGPVIYLDAQRDYDEMTQQLKLAMVRRLYPNVRIHSFPRLLHNNLYLLNDEMISFYQELFQKTEVIA